MFVLFVPAWIVYALVIWAVVCGLASISLHIIIIRYVQSRIIYVEDEKPEQEKPSNLIVLHSDETGY